MSHHEGHEDHEVNKESDKTHFRTFVLFVLLRKYLCRYDPGDEWHEVSVIPAQAGIHPLPPLDAGLRQHDESRKTSWAGGMAAISYSVDEPKLMNTSW
jgi:hypothetical protein